MEQKPILTGVILPTLLKTLLGAVCLGALLFLCAWNLGYWQAWAMMASLLIPMGVSGVYYEIKVPGLIERRALKDRNLTRLQTVYMTYVYLAEFVLLLLPALDYRFGWSQMPIALCIIGDILLVLANIVWMISKTENPYAGSSVKIYDDHRLVTTGPYATIRHPNYFGDLLMILGIPLALGSWWGLVVFVMIIPAMVIMIHDEEGFLQKNLPGYSEYMLTTRYRLIPYIW